MSEERRQARVIQNGNPFADAQRHLAPQPVQTVVDGGANVGDVAQHMLANFSAATIYAFEPDPICFRALTSRYREEPRVKAFALGLSNSAEPLTLHQYAESGLNAIRPLSAGSSPFLEGYGTAATGAVSVPMTTLDAFAAQEHLARIDFLKLDLQGWEVVCLRGARSLLKSGRIGAIYVEVNFVGLYEDQIFYEDVAMYLRSFGYRLFSFYALSFNRDDQLAWADALFLPNR